MGISGLCICGRDTNGNVSFFRFMNVEGIGVSVAASELVTPSVSSFRLHIPRPMICRKQLTVRAVNRTLSS
jgi:hypothetical protein